MEELIQLLRDKTGYDYSRDLHEIVFHGERLRAKLLKNKYLLKDERELLALALALLEKAY